MFPIVSASVMCLLWVYTQVPNIIVAPPFQAFHQLQLQCQSVHSFSHVFSQTLVFCQIWLVLASDFHWYQWRVEGLLRTKLHPPCKHSNFSAPFFAMVGCDGGTRLCLPGMRWQQGLRGDVCLGWGLRLPKPCPASPPSCWWHVGSEASKKKIHAVLGNM